MAKTTQSADFLKRYFCEANSGPALAFGQVKWCGNSTAADREADEFFRVRTSVCKVCFTVKSVSGECLGC